MQKQFNLGETLKDSVTGFTGIAISKVVFLNGCIQYCVKPTKLGKDGKAIDGEYIDSQQLVFVDNGINKQVDENKTGTGAGNHNEHCLPR